MRQSSSTPRRDQRLCRWHLATCSHSANITIYKLVRLPKCVFKTENEHEYVVAHKLLRALQHSMASPRTRGGRWDVCGSNVKVKVTSTFNRNQQVSNTCCLVKFVFTPSIRTNELLRQTLGVPAFTGHCWSGCVWWLENLLNENIAAELSAQTALDLRLTTSSSTTCPLVPKQVPMPTDQCPLWWEHKMGKKKQQQ